MDKQEDELLVHPIRERDYPTCWVKKLAICLFSGAVLSGCGGSSEPNYQSIRLEGLVQVDGEPISQGSISILPRKNNQGTGVEAEIKEGKYVIEKAPLGPVIVQLHSQRETGRMKPGDYGGAPVPEYESLIPSRYAGGIPLTLSTDKQQYDFDLESRQRFKKRRPRRP